MDHHLFVPYRLAHWRHVSSVDEAIEKAWGELP